MDKEIQDTMNEFYLIQRNLLKFLKRTISFSVVSARTFDRARSFTRTFDRRVVRGEYNDLKICRLLLLLWRGKMIVSFFIIQLEKGECVWIFLFWSGKIYDEFFNSGEEKKARRSRAIL